MPLARTRLALVPADRALAHLAPRPRLPLALLPTLRSPAAFSASVPSLLLSCKQWLISTLHCYTMEHDTTTLRVLGPGPYATSYGARR
jgi:hypothetical protein